MRIGFKKPWVWVVAPSCLVALHVACAEGTLGTDEPVRRTIEVTNSEREYFVLLPANHRPGKTFWPLVSVHGGGGSGRNHFLSTDLRRAADEIGLDAIVIAPSFSKTDVSASRFPTLGEGQFLRRVLQDARTTYRLQPRILLTGYSRGGQFSHRFAFNNPHLVAAVAPFSAGTWTMPNGALLIESVGTVRDPLTFLTRPQNLSRVPSRLHDLFTPRVAQVAGLTPRPGARDIPFLVMCGSLDSRFTVANQFVGSLEAAGYRVETDWPRTPHGSRNAPEFQAEFKKYAYRAIEFFLKVTKNR